MGKRSRTEVLLLLLLVLLLFAPVLSENIKTIYLTTQKEKVRYNKVYHEGIRDLAPDWCEKEVWVGCLSDLVKQKGLGDKDFAVLIEIINAESNWRQFDQKGEVLRGVINHKDVGFCQINEFWHQDEAISKGIDIHTPKGNLEFCVDLYSREGTTPWNWSKDKWEKQAF